VSLRRVPAAILLAGVAVLPAARGGDAAPAPPDVRGEYPFETVLSFEAGLFHWVDSLAGTSGGKTIPAYQRQFSARFGRLTPEDRTLIVVFREIREKHASDAAPAADPKGARRGYAAMLGIFLEGGTQQECLARLEPELGAEACSRLQLVLQGFRSRYETLWKEARHMPQFAAEMDRARTRAPIESFLAELARFFGVSAVDPPRPRLVIVPVPGGGGTHAQAVDETLLLEIRPGDTPQSQISVIAHENSHFLFNRIPPDRMQALEQAATSAGPAGPEFWRLLHEALPTALGQGIASARYDPSEFQLGGAWYHLGGVDRTAKTIYPVVRDALDAGRPLDATLVRAMYTAGHRSDPPRAAVPDGPAPPARYDGGRTQPRQQAPAP